MPQSEHENSIADCHCNRLLCVYSISHAGHRLPEPMGAPCLIILASMMGQCLHLVLMRSDHALTVSLDLGLTSNMMDEITPNSSLIDYTAKPDVFCDILHILTYDRSEKCKINMGDSMPYYSLSNSVVGEKKIPLCQ